MTLVVIVCGCTSDDVIGPDDLLPPLAIPGTATLEPRLSAALQSAVSTLDGQVYTRMIVTNSLTETVTSAACAFTADARPVNGTQWRNVRPESSACTFQVVGASPGGSFSLSVAADLAMLRAVAGGSGRNVVLRARHEVSCGTKVYAIQSTEHVVMVP